MDSDNFRSEMINLLSDISSSLNDMGQTLVSIKDEGLTLNNQATEAFTSAIQNGSFNDLFGAFTGQASSTVDVKDIIDSLKSAQENPSGEGIDSAQSLINSLREAKERLSTISSTINSQSEHSKNSD
tara:strand:+ start:4043 stop:4423 length:381 start_codon:yes stop_codon:yes gene_type:complete